VIKSLVILLTVFLGGCFSTPAIQVDNICQLMDEKVSWYQAAKASETKYKVPMSLLLAFIYQESHFASDARPGRKKIFGFIPWTRASSSYGFSQAKKSTWKHYQQVNNRSNAKRNYFVDSIDFVAWYVARTSKLLGIKKSDTYQQYLAYHEGLGGFKKHSFQNKPWLMRVAHKVATKENIYQNQLNRCIKRLDNNKVWSFF
jgi:hypothetical protein